jgi:hypothetical protein
MDEGAATLDSLRFSLLEVGMALRDQPYIPFYVQDFMTDEKLSECSAEATGVYIRIMCLLHKSHEYGTILLKQKDKQTTKQINNFALKLVKHMPYSIKVIESGLTELIDEGVLILDGDRITQRRMVKDNDISLKRSKAGKKGGTQTQFAKAKDEANTENEYEYENEVVIKTIIERVKEFEIEIINLNHQHKILSDSEIRKFVNYWTEHGGRAKKFRQEKQTTWNSKIRLERWHLNLQKYDNTNQRNNEQVEPEVPNYSKTVEQVEREQKELFRRQRGET